MMRMLAETFLEKDTGVTTNSSQHKSFFSFAVGPEYITSEILLSVLYRQLGFNDLSSTTSDKFIPFLSRDLKKTITTDVTFSVEPFSSHEIRTLLEEIVTVPKEATQRDKYKEQLFLYPLTPYAALFSHPVKLKSPKGDPFDQSGSTPWSPASILKQMFIYATKDETERTALWHELFEALSIQDGEEEDYFANCFDGILKEYVETKANTYQKDLKWSAIKDPFAAALKHEYMTFEDREGIFKAPHKVFTDDLRNLLKLKKQFSRRQWLTLIEAYLRLSMSAFVAWTIHMHLQIYTVLTNVVEGRAELPTIEQLREKMSLSSNSEHSLFSYGELFAKNKRELVVNFGPAFYYIAFLLFVLERKYSYTPNWSSLQGFLESLPTIANHFKGEGACEDLVAAFGAILENKSAILKQKRNGKVKHLDQFFANLRQRNVADTAFAHYDQSYLARRRAARKNAPYVVIPGSALLLTLVFCCTKRSRTVVTLKTFREYLLNLGFAIKQSQIASFTLQLRNLGLTMDSPDAEEGVIILSPFTMEGK